MRPDYQSQPITSSAQRVRFWYVFLLLILSIFLVRLFYLQIIRHEHYRQAALQKQLKEYEIRAERGAIEAHDGERIVPLVLNEKRFTLFADPKFIKDPKATATLVAGIIGGDANEYETKMRQDTRYSVLAKKLSKEQKEKLDALQQKGIGTREEEYRTYPQGELAAHILGFVDDEGEGQYGVEQFLDGQLKGVPGRLRAITDAQGVPLVSNKDNVVVQPKAGQRVVLTVDIAMQKQLEDILKAGLEAAKSKSGSALILEAYTGAVKAMANLPTFNPAEFYKNEDPSVFNNTAVTSPLEVGSIMKPLTAAAALDKGVVTTSTTYFDPGFVKIDDATVTNVEEVSGAGTRSVGDILRMSLNTGAVFLLRQMGGGELNEQARVTWYDYMTDRYRLGKATGIEQGGEGYEAEGLIPDPVNGYGLNIQFANTAFGQGMSATPLQMGAALASVINGGTYYRPHLVDKVIDADGKETAKGPQVLRQGVVKEQVSRDIRAIMESVVDRSNRSAARSGYSVGGKTGTAQISKPGGGYYDDKYNGTYLGFVGGDKPQYVIVVRVNEPGIPGYAGSRAAAPVFASISNMLLNNFGVTPKGQ